MSSSLFVNTESLSELVAELQFEISRAIDAKTVRVSINKTFVAEAAGILHSLIGAAERGATVVKAEYDSPE